MNTENKKPATHGGARPGAGRKAKEETETTSFRVHSESLQIIRQNNYPINAEVNKLVKRIAKKIKTH